MFKQIILDPHKLINCRLVVSQQTRSDILSTRIKAKHGKYCYKADNKKNAKRCGCIFVINSDDLIIQVRIEDLALRFNGVEEIKP